jgi:hypothetical protein
MAVDVPQLLELSVPELEEVFRSSTAGPIPAGEADGTVLVPPGSRLEGPASKVIHFLVWRGKVFDPESGELKNRIGPLGLHLVAAKVYKDASWFDQKETIVLDYSQTSLVAHWIRDEIRLVGPGVYLGLVFWEHAKILHFALKFPS